MLSRKHFTTFVPVLCSLKASPDSPDSTGLLCTASSLPPASYSAANSAIGGEDDGLVVFDSGQIQNDAVIPGEGICSRKTIGPIRFRVGLPQEREQLIRRGEHLVEFGRGHTFVDRKMRFAAANIERTIADGIALRPQIKFGQIQRECQLQPRAEEFSRVRVETDARMVSP